MPRFFCDYCDAYLTHDSQSGRQQHIRGWKHRENFKAYYMKLYPEWAAKASSAQFQNQMGGGFAMQVGVGVGMSMQQMPPAPGAMPPMGVPGVPPPLPMSMQMPVGMQPPPQQQQQQQPPPSFQQPPPYFAPPPSGPPPQLNQQQS